MAETLGGRPTLTKKSPIFGVAATYIGTVVGAGFASGQEIQVFFARYGLYGFVGLILAGALFALAGERALVSGARNGPASTYYQTLRQTFGPLAPFLDCLLLAFLCVLSGVMLAGAGALAATLGWSNWLGVIATALLGLFVIAADIPGIVTVNKIVVPSLFCVAALVVLGSIGKEPQGVRIVPAAPSWLPSAFLYASYNTVLSLPVLTALGAANPDRRLLRKASLWGAAGLVLVGSLVLMALLLCPDAVTKSEVPLAAIAVSLGRPVGFIYSFVLWAEMFTTLVADVYGASARLRQLCGGSRNTYAAAVMALGIALSGLGFARLVKTAYPAFGLVCLVILVRLIWPRPIRRGAHGTI